MTKQVFFRLFKSKRRLEKKTEKMPAGYPDSVPYSQQSYPFGQLGPQPNDFALMEAEVNNFKFPKKFQKFVDLSQNSKYWADQADAYRTAVVPKDLLQPVISNDQNEVVMDDTGFLVDEDGKPLGNVRTIAAMPSKQRKVRELWKTENALREQRQAQARPPVVSLTQQVDETEENEQDDEKIKPQKSLLHQVSNHLKGACYDLAHFSELPVEGAGAKLKYACTRDNRLWSLGGLVLVTLLCICVIVVIALLIKKAVSKKKPRRGFLRGGYRLTFPRSRALPLVEITD